MVEGDISHFGDIILRRQNERRALNQLAAQRYLYSCSKRILVLQLILTIPGAILFSIVGVFYPDIRIWTVSYGIIVLFLNIIIFEPCQQKYQNLAANIQEVFDTDVLDIEWPEWKIRSKPDPEEITSAAKKYLKNSQDFSELENWYPVAIKSLPFSQARIICQRSSIRYDARLRRIYSNVVLVILISVIIMIFAYAIYIKIPFDQLVLFGITPLLPLLIWMIKENKKQKFAAEKLERLKEYVEKIWEKSLKNSMDDNEYNNKSRNLQSEIFDSRRSNPIVFDIVYNLFRGTLEDEMEKGAEELVQEVIHSLKS